MGDVRDRAHAVAEELYRFEDITDLDVDGYVDGKGVKYLGRARKQPNGKWHCLANVGGALCKVEVKITFGLDGGSAELLNALFCTCGRPSKDADSGWCGECRRVDMYRRAVPVPNPEVQADAIEKREFDK